MQIIKSIYNTKYFWLIAPLVIVIASWFMLNRSTNVNYGKGPAYDLIFGISVFNPHLKNNVNISPYVYEGTLYLQCDKVPDDESTSSTLVALYRYKSKTGTVEQIPLLTPDEMHKITGRQTLVLNATKNLKLNTDEQSPDGFKLSGPNWVKVDPVSNVLGNIVLFFLSGGFEDIMERESFPRLSKGTISIPMKSSNTILKNDADDAYPLGWVTSQENDNK